MQVQVMMDREALEHIVQNGKGPYSHVQEDGTTASGYWHKENHAGPETCVGCHAEQALQASR